MELTQKFQRGEMALGGNTEPITAIKIGDKYYVYSDGRHRIAALKALGVDQVPMLVTQIGS